MSKKALNFIFGVIALLIGGLLYILFRERSYITIIFRYILGNNSSATNIQWHNGTHIQYYLSDFLWAFSLGCILNGILEANRNIAILCSALAFICGLIWEILQFFQIVSGTFDPVDILMYFMAGIICYLINLKERKQ